MGQGKQSDLKVKERARAPTFCFGTGDTALCAKGGGGGGQKGFTGFRRVARRRIRLLLAVLASATWSPTGLERVPRRHFVGGRLKVLSLARAETTQMCGGGGSGWWTDDPGL